MTGTEGPMRRPQKMMPRELWVAETDIRKPMDIPSKAEKPVGGHGHRHPGAQMIRSGRFGYKWKEQQDSCTSRKTPLPRYKDIRTSGHTRSQLHTNQRAA